MKKILSGKVIRILKSKKLLEETLNLRITNRGKEVYIDGTGEDEYIGEKVIDAINFGFPISNALLIKKENLSFETLNIKDYALTKNIERVKGRIIGKGGRALKTLSNLTNCYFEIKENEIGIIGEAENLENATEAIISLCKGAKHGNVYSRLERNRPKEVYDLGLKDDPSRT